MQSPNSTKLKYTFKSDVLFKMLFVTYPHLLKRLVAVLLSIPIESINNFQLINTEMPPEEIGKKHCKLDIHMLVDGRKINLEIQVEDEGNYPERAMFHWARMYSSSLPSGNDYASLPKTIVISILGFAQFPGADVHSEFALLEVSRHEMLSDKMSFHFFELPKMPDVDSLDTANEKDLWLALFNANTEEELEKLVSTGGEVMSQAVEAYRGVTATEKFRYMEILRERTMHDEAQALGNARRKGLEEGRVVEREKWQNIIAGKDAQLVDKDAQLADKDAQLAAKDARIAELDAMLDSST